jgi:uncharacterized delta-60 repeat protein
VILKALSSRFGSCLLLYSSAHIAFFNILKAASLFFLGFSSAPRFMNQCVRGGLQALTAFLSLLATCLPAFPQGPGSLDTPFNTAVSGGEGHVMATAVLPDGRMIIVGSFTTVGGVAHENIAKLHADGSVDASFTASTDAAVNSVAVQADGKMVLGGRFTSVNGSVVSTTTGVNRIARLNADGTLDTTFNASGGIGLGGANNFIYCVVVQADGKLVLGGNFTSINGSEESTTTGVNFIARLNPDGTRDTAFNASGGTGLGGANNTVHSVAVQSDGKLVLGGFFTSVNGSALSTATGVNRIARLNPDGTRDTAFNTSGGTGLGGANTSVLSVAVQADGKLVLGGGFTRMNGSALSTATGVNRIARLNADGTRDTAFNTSGGTGLGGANSEVRTVAVQTDGKLLLGGGFTSVNGSALSATTGVNRIARLNADGTRDTAFNTSGITGLGGVNDFVYSVAVQADGKLLLGGKYFSVNGTARRSLARLTNDEATQSLTAAGTKQVLWTRSGAGPELSATTFDQSTDGGTSWTALGSGTRVVGTMANWQLSGLNLPGTVSVRARGRTTSSSYSGSSGLIEQIAAFTGLTTNPPPPIVTLNTANLFSNTLSLTLTGTNFDAITPGNNTVIFIPAGTGSVTASTATSLTVTSLSGLTPGALHAVVTTNGQNNGAAVQVATVIPPPAPVVTLNAANLLTNATTLTITGTNFDTFTPGNNTVTFTPAGTGSVTASTATSLTVTGLSGLTPGALHAVVTTNGQNSGAAVQVATVFVTPAGFLDTAFNTAVSGVGHYVAATAVLPDGRMIIGGSFNTVGGMAHENIARLHADGSVDASFTASANGTVFCVAVQADGKLVLGGGFTRVNGSEESPATGVNCIARLNADGTRDTAFNASAGIGLGGANDFVYGVAVQADGKLVLGGYFTSVNGSALSTATGVNRIARLNADGTLDTAFNASGGTGLGGANGSVYSVAVQADGKLVLGGEFTSVNNSAVSTTTGVNRIARLNADGTRDTDFNTSDGTGLGGAKVSVLSVAVQADGKLLIGGGFTSVNGSVVSATTGVNRITRLNADGTRDITFNAIGGIGLGGANGSVFNVTLQADGKLVIGGNFTSVNGTVRGSLARLINDEATQSLTAADTARLLWNRHGAGPELSATTFEQSTDGGTSWTALGSGTRVGSTANWQLSGLTLPNTVSIRARGRTTSSNSNGSSGLVEQVAAFTGLSTPPPPTVILNTANLPIIATTLTITGSNFDAVAPGNNSVGFTPMGTGTVTASTATTLTVTSLSGLKPGALNAIVTTNGQSSGDAVQVATVSQAIQDWRQFYFGRPDNGGNAADNFDADGDGLVNLLEYAFGLIPTNGSSLSLPQPQIMGNNFTTDFTGVSGVIYAAEWSSSLLPGDWLPITDTGAGDQHTFTIPVGSILQRFMRLRVTRP